MGQGQNVANKLFSELDFEPKFKLKEAVNGTTVESESEDSKNEEV